jgi:hypothetical protein
MSGVAAGLKEHDDSYGFANFWKNLELCVRVLTDLNDFAASEGFCTSLRATRRRTEDDDGSKTCL